MGRKAANTVAYNDQAVGKIVREAKGQPQKEWRVIGVDGLVLVTQPTGAGVFYLFYRNKAAGKGRKYRIGEFVSESEAERHKNAGPDAPKPLTLAEARVRAERLRHAIRDGADPVVEAEAKANAMTFRALAEQFLSAAPHLAATTRRNYRQYLEKDVYPVIGDLPAADVTADHVVNICKAIEASGASVQSQNAKTAIGGVYRWGVRQRVVKANPCAGIGRRSPLVARTRAPTDGELVTLWNAAENRKGGLSEAMALIVQLAVLTAQRRTEVAGARISELQGLETDAPVWIIPGDINKRGKIIEGRTKNGREQRVPLSRQAAELFRRAVALSNSGEYVFPGDKSKVKIGKAPRMPHVHSGSVTHAMRRLREAAGVDDLSLHDMRRAVSTWLKDQDVSREVRDLVLNHKDGSVTEAHYSSAARMEKQVRAALQAWADHVWGIIGQAEQPDNVTPLRRAG
jgi:integrase